MFLGGERLILLHILLFSCIGETHLSLQGKPSLLEAAAFEHCYPVRMELVFERNTS
jgi:hypothetical protein